MDTLKETLDNLIEKRDMLLNKRSFMLGMSESLFNDIQVVEKELLDIFYSTDYRDAILDPNNPVEESDYETLSKELDKLWK